MLRSRSSLGFLGFLGLGMLESLCACSPIPCGDVELAAAFDVDARNPPIVDYDWMEYAQSIGCFGMQAGVDPTDDQKNFSQRKYRCGRR